MDQTTPESHRDPARPAPLPPQARQALVHGRLQGSNTQNAQITCKLRGWCDYKQGDHVSVQFKKCHFFDKETTNAIR